MERVERFLSKVEFSDAECWVWRGARNEAGYGLFDNMGAHRASYELLVGEIPEGLLVCHRCDNPWCVNPRHLFLGSQKDNLRDMVEKGRSARGIQNSRSKLSEAEVLELRRRYEAGESREMLARDFCITRGAVWNIGTRKQWKHLPGGVVNENHGNARIDAEQVRSIREAFAGGSPQAQLATEFRLSRGHINKIVRRLIWKHV